MIRRIWLAFILTLQCLCCVNTVIAGKGKGNRQGHIIVQNEVKGPNLVPIYMPIPIPVPMSMGPGKMSGHEQSQHQHHRSEGEVKKIYLLQPMTRFQQPTQQKGGFFQHPMAQQAPRPIHKTRPPPATSQGDTDYQSHHHFESRTHEVSPESLGNKAPSGKSGHSELKILPIVVIPPIAPMPPIQLSPGNQQTDNHKGRISFSPQFHNYLVTNSEPSEHKLSSDHSISDYQDHNSFSDYGGSVGASLYRGGMRNSRGRFAPSPNRVSRPENKPQGRNMMRVSQDQEDFGSATSYAGRNVLRRDSAFVERPYQSSIWRQQQARSSQWNGPKYSNRKSFDKLGMKGRGANSIRDIMQNVVSFDDDPNYELDQDYRDTLPSMQIEYHERDKRRLPLSSSDWSGSDSTGVDSYRSTSQRDYSDRDMDRFNERVSNEHLTLESGGNGFSSSHRSRRPHASSGYDSRPGNMHSVDDETFSDRQRKQSQSTAVNLGAVYYDHDPPDQPHDSDVFISDRLKSHSFDGLTSGNPSSGRRPHSQMENNENNYSTREDEWRFDTIKSVVHASPALNSTQPNLTGSLENHPTTSSPTITGESTKATSNSIPKMVE